MKTNEDLDAVGIKNNDDDDDRVEKILGEQKHDDGEPDERQPPMSGKNRSIDNDFKNEGVEGAIL